MQSAKESFDLLLLSAALIIVAGLLSKFSPPTSKALPFLEAAALFFAAFLQYVRYIEFKARFTIPLIVLLSLHSTLVLIDAIKRLL